MKKQFLPKALDREQIEALCVDTQDGASSTDMHWHSCAEIIHMRRGSAMLYTDDSWCELRESDTVFIAPGRLHSCQCTDQNASRAVIGLTSDVIGKCGIMRERILSPFLRDTVKGASVIKGNAVLTELFAELCAHSGEGVAAELTKKILVERIYCEMLGHWERCGVLLSQRAKSEVVSMLESILDERYSEDISAQDAALAVNVSYSYMAKLLLRETGSSFGALLLARRLEAAKRLLLTTDASITEIGVGVGFTDASYFIKKFRASVGMTPQKYRASYLERLNAQDKKSEDILHSVLNLTSGYAKI